jgi:ppGpp synthetase/RelA/SpoT-type nucleotidyltranferase
MNFEMYERQIRSDYAGLAETVATVLAAAIREQPSLRLQQVQHRAKDPASLKKKLEKANALESKNIEDITHGSLIFRVV